MLDFLVLLLQVTFFVQVQMPGPGFALCCYYVNELKFLLVTKAGHERTAVPKPGMSLNPRLMLLIL